MIKNKKYTEVLWCGRGGQGAITASQLIAEAAVIEGYEGITTAPSFGAERRGAPISAFLRLAHKPIRIFSQIDDPDIIVVLDASLLPVLDLKGKYKNEAIVVVNSAKTPDELGLEGFKKTGIADITKISLGNNLTMAGQPILNTPILGAVVKATGLVDILSVKKSIYEKFSPEKAELNFHAAELIYHSTEIYENNVKVQ